jgi:hypothetical protein
MINTYIQTGLSVLLVTGQMLVSMVSASTEPLLERLRSDHAAMVSAESDFRSRRERGTLSGNEAADYATYVAGLVRRVAEDCVALAETSAPVPDDLSCPVDPPQTIAPAAIDLAGEQTGTEVIAKLDAELFAGLGEFDEMLLREQERVKAAAPRTDGGSGGGGGGSGSDAGDFDDGEESESDSASGGETTHGQGAGPGSPRTGADSSAPPGTPDGSDDDVVARQLREAAEKESDPELKKKLWEEYRKYKQGTS